MLRGFVFHLSRVKKMKIINSPQVETEFTKHCIYADAPLHQDGPLVLVLYIVSKIYTKNT